MQHTPTTFIKADHSIEMRARDIILTHRRLFNRLDDLDFECRAGYLIVSGELPTYYAKQLLQTALRQLADVTIVNRVTVRTN